MEPAEDTSLEAAIRWLVRTILGVLLMDKLDAWVRGVKLDDDVAKLKFEVERAESLIEDVRGRADGNRSLARSLARLKEVLYDADDVVDELDYYRLQQQVEGVITERVTETSMGDADTPRNSSVGKTRSLVWNHFTETERVDGKATKAKCNHCLNLKEYNCNPVRNGTTAMLKHMQKKHTQIWNGGAGSTKPTAHPPNPSSTSEAPESATATEVATSSSRKRRRPNEELPQTTAAVTRTSWDKAELSNKIKTVTCQLHGILEILNKDLERCGSGSAPSSYRHLSTITDKHRTSSLVPREVYGRVALKDSIIELITEDQSDVVTVLPIVGIAGVGKTVVAQLVYNDPKVKNQFHHRIWVWVSHNFDEVRITREMIDFVSPKTNEGSSHINERHEGLSSFAKLQEILKEHMEYREHMDDPLKKFLLILDDVWDNMDDDQPKKLLAPLMASQIKGNVILVTTRNLSVAKRLGTLQPVKLSALADDDFWLLFESHAFGNKNCEGNESLRIIGRKIAEKLKGNPLAAENAGELLRKYLTVDHWSNVLKKEHWKSFQLSRGIMPALKLSYDQLTYPSQHCFSYTSIFPSNYHFHSEELARIWISQGFVNTCDHPSKRLEEIAQNYLMELVNLGFFQQVEGKKEPSLGSQIQYSVCGLMNDFAMVISRTKCATIDGLQYNKMLPSIQHLSILTDSAYNNKDQHGNILRNEKFEEYLRNAVTSVSKLRTLVLLGHYDSFFLQLFKDIFRKAENLRLLQMSASSADFNSLMCSLVNPAHLRYLKREPDGSDGALPLVLTKNFHLQVLDVGSNTDPIIFDGMHNLVCLRHLVAEKGVYSKIANVGSMISLQELEFNVQLSSSGFGIAQLQSMNELVQLELSQLDSVKTREEANQARLGDKVHLEKLHLSWEDTLLDEEYGSDSGSESSEELRPMDGGGPSSEPCMDTSREVLEGLEPHMGIKHLQISGYSGTTSPTWLAKNISVTSLQTLCLDGCRGWRMLPSLESLPFLTKLKLTRMKQVTEVLVPSLEELVLIEMPKLVRCSSTCVEGLNCSLRVLQVENCKVLEEFDLFENNDRFEIEQRSWLPGLRKLILCDCPLLEVLNPLPPSATCFELNIDGVSFPSMEGSSNEELCIADEGIYECSDKWRILDDKILAFHNLRNLKSMCIVGCEYLSSFSLEGFSQLVSLKSLKISTCKELFSPDVTSEHTTTEDVTTGNWKAFPFLQCLSIELCGIAGKWLSLLLRHAPHLEELNVEEEEDSSSGEQDGALNGLAQYGLVHMPLNLMFSLKKISIQCCRYLTFNCSEEEGFSGFTSLQKLTIWKCPELFASLVHKDGNDDQANGTLLLPTSLELLSIQSWSQQTLQPCFPPSDLTNLKRLTVDRASNLESLQLRSCTALEELTITNCGQLAALEGLQSLVSLRHLAVSYCPGLRPCLERFSRQGCELLPRLETLHISVLSVLTTSICNHLTSLRRLKLQSLVLTEEQGTALLLLTSLQELEFYYCPRLVDLPAGLHLLPSLKKLKIISCKGISRLPETGLPLSLEELEIKWCSEELADQCRALQTSKLRVNINGDWFVS